MSVINNPKISIINVVYNAALVLESTILSVINQTYTNIEYIIVDGNSTDNTPELIEKYRNKIDIYISEPDAGIYDAMNKGCKAASGDFFYFLGAGDVLFNVLHHVTKYMDNKRILYGDVYKLDELKIYDRKFTPFKLAVKNICHQAIFYPAKVFSQLEFNLKFKFQADYDLNLRLFGNSSYRFKYIPIIICGYEGDGLSATVLDIPFFLEKLHIVKTNLPLPVYYYALVRNRMARLIKKNYWSNDI